MSLAADEGSRWSENGHEIDYSRILANGSWQHHSFDVQSPDAVRFWLAVLFTGLVRESEAAALTRLLEVVQHVAWSGSA